MEVSWKGVMEVMRHGKRHGKCVMEASRKGVMDVVCHGSAMERRHGSDASRKRHGKGVVEA